MNFNFFSVKEQIQSFIDFYMEEFNKNKDIDSNRGHFELVKLCKNLDSEEKLFSEL